MYINLSIRCMINERLIAWSYISIKRSQKLNSNPIHDRLQQTSKRSQKHILSNTTSNPDQEGSTNCKNQREVKSFFTGQVISARTYSQLNRFVWRQIVHQVTQISETRASDNRKTSVHRKKKITSTVNWNWNRFIKW